MMQSLGDILRKIVPKQVSHTGLEVRWREIVSETEARWTRIAGLKKGVLSVKVENAALFQELKTYRKHALIQAWNQGNCEKILDIKFLVA